MLYEIPALVKPNLSPRGKEVLAKVRAFVEDEIIPASVTYKNELDALSDRFSYESQILEELKDKAKKAGLWNLFLPNYYSEGAGFSNLEYALMAEQMGRVLIAAEVFNCNAPDTGNMEVLARFANDAQKKEWLTPLLEGKIRSAFCMTEKGNPSSDARNIDLSIKSDGDSWVLNGTKWWASGAGDPRCQLLLVMGRSNNNKDPYRQQSVVIVPRNTPGVTIVRPMMVMGYDDAPHGHMEIKFENARVPKSNIIGKDGDGFAIIQGRLGPGRIHHCMRSMGVAQEALKLLVERAKSRETFGKKLVQHGRIQEWISRSRIEILEGRLLVLNAAAKMDSDGPKGAMEEISIAKIECPSIALQVVDRAMQTYGAEGLSQDTPLAYMWANLRTLRLADGPDEVHMAQLARRTISKL